jgi:hypothetical protein
MTKGRAVVGCSHLNQVVPCWSLLKDPGEDEVEGLESGPALCPLPRSVTAEVLLGAQPGVFHLLQGSVWLPSQVGVGTLCWGPRVNG